MSKKLNLGKMWFLFYPIGIPLFPLISCAKKDLATAGSGELYSFTFSELYQQVTIKNGTTLLHLPYGSAVISVRTRILTASSVNCSVHNDETCDYSHPLSITLSKGRDIKEYVVQFDVDPPDIAVRVSWITNVGSLC